MKKILLILVSILSILTLTACGKTDEELDKEFDDKVYNTLIIQLKYMIITNIKNIKYLIINIIYHLKI